MRKMRTLNLDTAAEHEPSHSEREFARMMRERPHAQDTLRGLRFTKGGNVVQARA